jgi:hypothetical protein
MVIVPTVNVNNKPKGFENKKARGFVFPYTFIPLVFGRA